MACTTIHLIPSIIIAFLEPLWLYSAAGSAAVIVILLLFFFIKSSKQEKKTLEPSGHLENQDISIQQIHNTVQKSSGPVLLAASGLADLPVTIPVNLAVSLAASGKCLLIDLDSKRDALAKVFGVDSSKIAPHLKISPLTTEFENLSVWPARYFDLLKQMNLRSLLNTAAEKYDYILLYAPYLTVLADRKQIASCSKQAIIFHQNSEKTAPLRHLLEACNCRILMEA